MKLPSVKEMRAIDRAAVSQCGIPGAVLMENAGVQVFHSVRQAIGGLAGKKIFIFAGKGNNGGDGMVAARHLANHGARVKVFLFSELDQVSDDAKLNLHVIQAMGLEVAVVRQERDWDMLRLGVNFADLIVDALLGTGFKGPLSHTMQQAINIINNADKLVVAVDIPSGIYADTGQMAETAVCAQHTVALALLKAGLLLYPGAQQAGKVRVVDIGIPQMLLTDPQIRQTVVQAAYVGGLWPERKPTAHKGDSGRVLVVAGSRGLTGAAALTSLAALRTGAGLVTLAVPHSVHDIMEIKLTEVMTTPLPDENGALNLAAAPAVGGLLKNKQVLAIGPGLGQAKATQAAVRDIIRQASCPIVIDADGLNAFIGHTELLKDLEMLAVLTPHAGELARLTGMTVEDIESDRLSAVRLAADEWRHIVVLKGAPTVIAFPDGEVFVNTTGNAGLATGGTGDVLTGMIAAGIAQGMSCHDAAVAGIFIHGAAADKVAGQGMIGVIASDLLAALPNTIAGIIAESKA